VTTLGTPYEIDTRDTILFLEDVSEQPYRIDRMLTHLKHAGKLAEIRGIVFGSLLDCDGGQGDCVLRDVVTDVVGNDIPIVAGFDAGHGTGNVVLPFGCRVRLDTSAGQLTLLEPVFS
jgi:muramoyltetrapeptide carboxypeptidase